MSNVKNPENQAYQSNGNADQSQGHTIELKGLADPQNMLHSVKTANAGHSDGMGMSSGTAGTKRDVDMTNSLGNHLDALCEHSNIPSIGFSANAAAHAPETFRTAQEKKKSPNSLNAGTWTCHPKACEYCY